MARMKPSEYVQLYHNLPVTAVGPDGSAMAEVVHISKYQVNGNDERSKLLTALKKVLGLKTTPNLTTTNEAFFFPNGDVIGSMEPFYWHSFRRAFYFKGSPYEMQDCLRIAYRLGRTGKGKDVAGQKAACLTMGQYANTYFGQDCNGLVGNYYNLSPALYIGTYGSISQKEEDRIEKKVDASGYWNGWARAEALSLDYLPLSPRNSAEEARDGDILVDVENGTKYAHIALVQDVSVLDKDTVSWRVVEWGQGTNVKDFDTENDKHIKPIKKHKLGKGAKKNYGVGHYNDSKSRFRYLFAGPDHDLPPASWGRCGVEGV